MGTEFLLGVIDVKTLKLQNVRWPGVVAFDRFSYEVNHGVSPNLAILTTYPQGVDVEPKEFGDLSWTDGQGEWLTIKGCRAKVMTGEYSPSGQTWVLHILDPRWMWTNTMGGLSGITGHYNRRDERGELVPWTIRSAEELIHLCLDQMGVAKQQRRIRAPLGYTKKDGEKLQRKLFLGERFKPSGTNLEFIWDHTPPAEAITQLCQQYGLRLVWQPFSGLVIVAPPGEGRPLPAGAVELEAPNIQLPQTPVAVAAYGSEIRIQCRIDLTPLGKEYTNWPVDADKVSYAPPLNAGTKQKSEIRFVVVPPFRPHMAVIEWTDANGVEHRVEAWSFDVSTANAFLNDIAAQLTQRLGGGFSVSVSGDTLTIECNTPGQVFDVTLKNIDVSGAETLDFEHKIVQQAGGPNGADWSYSHPPVFPNVRATPQLAYFEARSHARDSVFRWFRTKMKTTGKKVNKGPSQVSTSASGQTVPPTVPPPPVTGRIGSEVSTSWIGGTTEEEVKVPKGEKKEDGLWIPYYSDKYGLLKRREQLTLLSTKVEQVVPADRIKGGQDRGNPVPPNIASGILPEAYTGYSRDQAAVVRGSIYVGIGSVNWWQTQNNEPGAVVANNQKVPLRPMNTKRTDRVYVPFNIQTCVNGEQIISFPEPIYYWNQQDKTYSKYDFPELTLETSVTVRHPISDIPLRWEEVLPIPGGTGPIQWYSNPELKVGIVGLYDDNNNLKGWKYADGDLEYVRAAARHFLRGKAAQFYVKGGECKSYVRTLRIEPDPLIQQVSWTLGPGGPATRASSNSEHSPFWPDYPQRVRPELMSPNKLAAQANEAERRWIDQFNPMLRNARPQ